MLPDPGAEIHYVIMDTETPGAPHPRHVKARLDSVSSDQKAALSYGGSRYVGVKLALSREPGTWHPIGGYGC